MTLIESHKTELQITIKRSYKAPFFHEKAHRRFLSAKETDLEFSKSVSFFTFIFKIFIE